MKGIGRQARALLLAGAIGLGTVVATAVPANAAETCQQVQGSLGLPDTCTQWTGGYPSGQVRADGSSAFYTLSLQRCSTALLVNCTWTTITYGHNIPYTSWQPTTKFGWFRACSQWQKGGSFPCGREVYLGD